MAADEPNPDELEIADELIAERRAEAPGETPEDMTAWQRPITAAIDVIKSNPKSDRALFRLPLEIRQLIRPLLNESLGPVEDG